jgi:hypothetical protein
MGGPKGSGGLRGKEAIWRVDTVDKRGAALGSEQAERTGHI